MNEWALSGDWTVTNAADDAPLGRGAAKAQATRAALVELAADLFAEQGYIQTSIRDRGTRSRHSTFPSQPIRRSTRTRRRAHSISRI